MDDLQHQIAELRNPANGHIFKHDVRLRSVAWSPSGCSPANTALLSTCDSNGQVRSPPAHFTGVGVAGLALN